MTAPEPWLYRLIAVERLPDGDTAFLRVEREIDYGFRRRWRTSSVEEFRFALDLKRGIDCPESKGPTRAMGLLAHQRTSELLASWLGALPVEVACWGQDDKYGRWLADVRLLGVPRPSVSAFEGDGPPWTVCSRLVAEGYAQVYDGRGPRPHWDPAVPYPLPPELRSRLA